jgi:N-acetylglutamate synthase-like GNAT family acetyltransferase
MSTAVARTLEVMGLRIQIRTFTAEDADAMLSFARLLPPHDVLFMRRRISEPKVVAAWIKEAEAGRIPTLVAAKDGVIVGSAAILTDPLSWSQHVAEFRLVVSAEVRGHGVGKALMQESLKQAVSIGVDKLMAYLTVDQRAAIAVFEEIGFKPEAVFQAHVKDLQGNKHDVVVLCLDVERYMERMQTFVGEA